MALISNPRQVFPQTAYAQYRMLDIQNDADQTRAHGLHTAATALYDLVTDPIFDDAARALLDQRYCDLLRSLKNVDEQIKRRSQRLDELHPYLSDTELREIHGMSFPV